MIDHQHNHGADEGDEDAVEVDAVGGRVPDRVEDEAAHQGPDNAQHDIHHKARSGPVDDLAGQEASDQPDESCEN